MEIIKDMKTRIHRLIIKEDRYGQQTARLYTRYSDCLKFTEWTRTSKERYWKLDSGSPRLFGNLFIKEVGDTIKALHFIQ